MKKEDISLKSSNRKICVITGTRAEYSILSGLMKEIQKNDNLTLQIIATCMHLSHEFGLTYKCIEEDGFVINKKIEILLSSDTPVGVSKAIGLGAISFAEALSELSPDILVVPGDRFEALAAAIAAMCLRIPVAHIGGGETTEGAIDEYIRHSITKMSHIHFVTTDVHARRVIQLGELPTQVFNVGALGVYNAKNLKLYNRNKVQQLLNFELGRRNLLITFHPATLEETTVEKQFSDLLLALNWLKDVKLIFTKPNADMGGRIIIDMIDTFVRNNQTKSVSVTNLGTVLYLSLLQFVDGVVGNSSSGIIEAPTFKIATVNIGNRQSGRVKADSVIDCISEPFAILAAIGYIYLDDDFRKIVRAVKNPYEGRNTINDIINVLSNIDISGILRKKFYDSTSF